MPTSNQPLLVLGIDPGIDITGFGIIEQRTTGDYLIKCGVIRTNRRDSLPKRLKTLHDDLNTILTSIPHVTVAGVEELFFAKNAKTAFTVGQARGVILFTLMAKNLTIIDIKPKEAKQALTGNGNAHKKEIQKMITLRFGLKQAPQPDDAADAVAIALTAAAQFRQQKRYT